MTKEKIYPFSKAGEILDINKSKIYYFFLNKASDEEKKRFLVVRKTKRTNGKMIKRYYVKESFIPFYLETEKRGEEMFHQLKQEFIEKYTLFIEELEESEHMAQVDAEENSVKDNLIVEDIFFRTKVFESRLSKLTLKKLKEKEGRELTSYDRRIVGCMVYRHIFLALKKQVYLESILSAFEDLSNEYRKDRLV